MLAHETKDKTSSIVGSRWRGVVRRILSAARNKLARPRRVLPRDYAILPTEASSPHGWIWHTMPIIHENGAFWPRFMDALCDDAIFRDAKRLAAYFGMAAHFSEDEWPDDTLESELMDVAHLLPPAAPPGAGWFLAGLWENEEGSIVRLYMRRLTNDGPDLKYARRTLGAVFGHPADR